METDLNSQDRKDLDKFIKFFALKVMWPFWFQEAPVQNPLWKWNITDCSLPILRATSVCCKPNCERWGCDCKGTSNFPQLLVHNFLWETICRPFFLSLCAPSWWEQRQNGTRMAAIATSLSFSGQYSVHLSPRQWRTKAGF